MSGLLRAEWLKLSRRWVLPAMILVLGGLVGLSAVILLILPDVAPEAIEGLPILDRADASLLGIQTVLGQTWFPLILAVIMLGTEFTSSAWAAALTRDARRFAHLLAKVIVFSLAAWLVALLAIACWEIMAAIFTEGDPVFEASDWFGVIWKALIVQVTWIALGLGAISLTRSTGVAIAIVVAYSFTEGLLALWAPYGEVSLTTATAAIFGELTAEVSSGFGVSGSDPMTFGQALLVVIGWGVLGLGLAWTGVRTREP